jgi:hypothetical protein
MVDELVTIKTFDEPMMAHLCRSFLDGHGIESYLGDEYLVGTDWLYANLAGGVKLQVKSSDAPKAMEILEEHEASKQTENDNKTSEQLHCPDCESSNVAENGDSSGYVYLMLFFVFALVLCIIFQTPLFLSMPIICWFMMIWVLQKKDWICHDCGYGWTGRKRPFGL